MQVNKEQKYFSTIEVANILGISRVAVFKKIKKGDIKAQKVGRNYAVLVSDLHEYLNQDSTNFLSESQKGEIKESVKKLVEDYGEALKLLGKE